MERAIGLVTGTEKVVAECLLCEVTNNYKDGYQKERRE